jgi:hypothetical protein
MALVMYDSIDVSQFAGLTMDAAAGYVDGACQPSGLSASTFRAEQRSYLYRSLAILPSVSMWNGAT